MKKLVFLVLSSIIFAITIYAQSLNDGMYDENWLREREAINQGWSQYMNDVNSTTNNQIEAIKNWSSTISHTGETQNRTSGGIRFETEYSPHSTYSSQQNKKNAQRDAERQDWLRQKGEAMRAAAEQENQRKLEKQQRKYNESYDEYMKMTEEQSIYFHTQLEYRATIGKDLMYNYKNPDMENLVDKLAEIYIPASRKSDFSASDIVDRQRQMYNNQNIIKPFEGKYYIGGTSNWDKALDAELIKNKIDRLPNAKQLSEEIAMNDYGESEIIDYKVMPIANGCGTGDSKGINISRVAADNASKVDIHFYMFSKGPILEKNAMQIQTAACNQHDLDYYHGIDKNEADLKLAKVGPVKGFALKENVLGIPQTAYDDAQKERAMTEYIKRKFNVSDDSFDKYYDKLVPIRKSDKMCGINNK